MKRILCFVSFLFLVNSSFAQSFNELSFKRINGDSVWLSGFAGKKVVFVVAPLSQTDSNFTPLQNFLNKYKDSVQVIGIVSIEDGYQPSNVIALQSMYNNSGILLTEGMYTRKGSGANQSALLRWLTDKNNNRHFDMDVRGIGQKFFVTGKGRLYAVMSPQVSFNAPIMSAIMNSQVQ